MSASSASESLSSLELELRRRKIPILLALCLFTLVVGCCVLVAILDQRGRHETRTFPTTVDLDHLCHGFLYETHISDPGPNDTTLDRIVPHFITLCDVSHCVTFTSRDFCDLLINLHGEN